MPYMLSHLLSAQQSGDTETQTPLADNAVHATAPADGHATQGLVALFWMNI